MGSNLQRMKRIVGRKENAASLLMGQIADELEHHLLIGEIQRGTRFIK